MVLIKFWIIFHGDYEECPCFNIIQGPLTSVSGHRATTGPRLQKTSVTTRGRSNTTGADTAGLASWGREINQVLPVLFFKLKSSWFIGLPWSQLVKNPPAMWETWVRSLGWEDPWGQGSPLQYSGLENSKDCIVHGVAKSRKRLRDWATALIHNVMLVSGIQQSDSNINISIPFFCSFFIMGYCYAI